MNNTLTINNDSPTLSNPPSSKSSLGKCMGRLFSAIYQRIGNIIQKIRDIASRIFTMGLTTTPQKQESVFAEDHSLKDQIKLKKDQKNEPAKDNEKLLAPSYIYIPDPEPELEPVKLTDGKLNPPPAPKNLKINVDSIKEGPATPDIPKTPPPSKTPIKVSPHKIIDVPSDGNCLFYSIAVGIAKMKDHPETQKKLNWKEDPSKLTGNLSKSIDLLKKPAETLREQATTWLEKNYKTIEPTLKSAIEEHLKAAQKMINEQQLFIDQTLKKDIEKLNAAMKKAEPNSIAYKDTEKELQEKEHHLAKSEQDLAQYKKNNLFDSSKEEEIIQYIKYTKQDRIFGTTAHAYALSQLYNIPIRIIGKLGVQPDKDGKNGQYETILNEFDSNGNKVAIVPITIAHVGGDHYQYVEYSQNSG